MKKRRFKRKRGSFRLKLFLSFFLIITAFMLIDSRLRPLVKTLATNQAKMISTWAINDAVTEELANQGINYEGIIKIEKDANGQVIAVSTDVVKMNKLKAAITIKVQEMIESLEERKLSISLGTLTGIDYFMGRGPQIPIKLRLSGSIYSELDSIFESAGINQTRHKIMLNLKTNIYVIIPGFSTATVVPSNFCIAESIIVGKVPDAYTEISGISEGTFDKINNYLDN